MSVLGQDVSDPGAKRNKEVRKRFKFSLNLGCSENWVEKGVCGGGELSQLLSMRQRGGGCLLRPLAQEEELELLLWYILAEARRGLTSLHRPIRSSLFSHNQDGSEEQDEGSG